jgi:ELWxxDGT repeat protein
MKKSLFSTAVLMLVLLVPLLAQNPRMIKDIQPGPEWGLFNVSQGHVSRDVSNGTFYISAYTTATGSEVWASQPPYDDAYLVKDLTPGAAGASGFFRAAHNKLYFIARTTGQYDQLCRSDGTAGGTGVFWSPSAKKYNHLFYPWATQSMFFTGRYVDGGTYELWSLNPNTGAATLLLSKPLPFDRPADLNGVLLTVATVRANITKKPPWTVVKGLLRSDGTTRGTTIYYELPQYIMPDGYPNTQQNPIYPGCNLQHPYKDISHLTLIAGGRMFFHWSDDNYGSELWSTNGTAAGTARITDINPGTGNAATSMLASMGNHVYFAAKNAADRYQIWRYPLAGGSAEQVTNFANNDAFPMWLTAADGWLYFSAYTEDKGRELWRSDGLPHSDPGARTELVMDINPGPASSAPTLEWTRGYAYDGYDQNYIPSMAVIGDYVYFAADDGTGYALWRSNGNGAQKLGGVNPRKLTPVYWTENGEPRAALLFASLSEAEGTELWKYDHWLPPSPKGTVEVQAPYEFSLSQNYPNPFNPSAVIRYGIPEAGYVRLSVYDTFGRRVATLVDGERAAGTSSVVFQADGLPSGTYVYQLESGGRTMSRIMMLVK